MLKMMAFVMGDESSLDESAQKAVKETAAYIQENGYDVYVADGKDPLPHSMSENK